MILDLKGPYKFPDSCLLNFIMLTKSRMAADKTTFGFYVNSVTYFITMYELLNGFMVKTTFYQHYSDVLLKSQTNSLITSG